MSGTARACLWRELCCLSASQRSTLHIHGTESHANEIPQTPRSNRQNKQRLKHPNHHYSQKGAKQTREQPPACHARSPFPPLLLQGMGGNATRGAESSPVARRGCQPGTRSERGQPADGSGSSSVAVLLLLLEQQARLRSHGPSRPAAAAGAAAEGSRRPRCGAPREARQETSPGPSCQVVGAMDQTGAHPRLWMPVRASRRKIFVSFVASRP